MRLSAQDRMILKYLQEDLPLVSEPFKGMAKKVGMKEDKLLKRIGEFKREGFIRNFSAGLNHKKLDFKSILLAFKVSEEKLEAFVKEIIPFKEITHCFLRENEYNLWVIFIYKNNALEEFLSKAAEGIGGENILRLRTVKKYKLNTNLEV